MLQKLMQRYTQAMAYKISRDLLWSFGSFFVLAICGVAMNLVIGFTRDASALGVFNLAYSFYLIASQIATMGVHYSVLRSGAYHQENVAERGLMLGSACVLALTLGLLFCAIVAYFAPLSAWIFKSKETAEAIFYAAFGLALFPLNKVMISYLNSLRHIRAFSLMQIMRYLIVFAVISYVSLSDMNFSYATLSFAVAEIFTCLACMLYFACNRLMHHLSVRKHWLSQHLKFGSKGVLAGIFLDLNTRLDVLLLGTMLNEHMVGIYSFAAMLMDGVQHVLALLRINFNPILVKALRDGHHDQAQRLLTLSKRYVTLGTAALCTLIVAMFFVATHYLMPDKGFADGLSCLLILCAGFTLIAGFMPFDNVLLVSGHPGYQTIQSALVTLMNVVLCFAIVPFIGVEGAALATVGAYVTGTMLLCLISPRVIGWDLLHNRFVRM